MYNLCVEESSSEVGFYTSWSQKSGKNTLYRIITYFSIITTLNNVHKKDLINGIYLYALQSIREFVP